MAELLSLREVAKSYRRGERRIKVLVDVSLDLLPRDVVAVVGSRYEGKTTLLKVAAGIEVPDAGTVRLDGHDLTRSSQQERSRLLGSSVAWTDGSGPAVHLRVLDYVALPIVMAAHLSRRKAEERAMAALERVSAAGCARARWGELSNWERVLVSLARAVAGEPRLLIVDELLDGLGVRRTREASALLASFARDFRCAILMSASELDAALIADRVYWFERGHLKPMSNEPTGEAEIIGFPTPGRRGEAPAGTGA